MKFGIQIDLPTSHNTGLVSLTIIGDRCVCDTRWEHCPTEEEREILDEAITAAIQAAYGADTHFVESKLVTNLAERDAIRYKFFGGGQG